MHLVSQLFLFVCLLVLPSLLASSIMLFILVYVIFSRAELQQELSGYSVASIAACRTRDYSSV